MVITLSSCDKTDTGVLFPDVGEPEPNHVEDIAFSRNKVIGRGINFGNALEAPNEGEWEQQSAVVSGMFSIKSWSDSDHRPVTIGEFGAIQEAAHTDRVRWTKFVRQQIEGHGFSWSYFDFGVIFKAYDIEKEDWLEGFPEAFFERCALRWLCPAYQNKTIPRNLIAYLAEESASHRATRLPSG